MPPKPSLDTLGQLIIERRGALGVRAAAKEIGVSPSTLSRVEGGHLPDLENFRLICRWLKIDPNQLLGFSDTKQVEERPILASLHLKMDDAVSKDTATALGAMIRHAHRALLAENNQ